MGDDMEHHQPGTSEKGQVYPMRKLVLISIGTVVGAALVLLLFVLPAEYGVDPTGLGRAMGLTTLNGEPTRTIELRDVIGGNESLREVEIPAYGEPTPLPNPAVFQQQPEPALSRTLEVVIPAEGETEVKLWLEEGKVAIYSWSVDQGDVYSDFHGHDISFGENFFVRYLEHQEGSSDHGSLTAPFDGEHGWYWLNYNDFEVTVTLEVTGFYEDVIDYGIF